MKKVTSTRKDMFFQVGHKYVVVTHPEQGSRFDGVRGAYHYFTKGETVTCLKVYDHRSPECYLYDKRRLCGEFVNSKGEEQDLFPMDLRAYHG